MTDFSPNNNFSIFPLPTWYGNNYFDIHMIAIKP